MVAIAVAEFAPSLAVMVTVAPGGGKRGAVKVAVDPLGVMEPAFAPFAAVTVHEALASGAPLSMTENCCDCPAKTCWFVGVITKPDPEMMVTVTAFDVVLLSCCETAVTVTCPLLAAGTAAGAVNMPLVLMLPVVEALPPVTPFTCQLTA